MTTTHTIARNELVTLSVFQIGWLRCEVRQPERVSSFADPVSPLLDNRINFQDGWKGDMPKVERATDADREEIGRNFERMMVELRKYKEVPQYTVVDATKLDDYGKPTLKPVTIAGFVLADRIEKAAKEANFPACVEFVGIDCNRRGYKLLSGLMSFLDFDATRTPEQFLIPCQIVDYKGDVVARQKDLWRENDAANEKQGYSFVGNVQRCMFLLKNESATEADCTATFGLPRGQVQPAYATAVLASRLPELRIVERLQMPVPMENGKKLNPVPYDANGYLPASVMKPDALRVLNGNKPQRDKTPNQVAVSAFGVDESNPYSVEVMANAKQVEEYFRLTIEDGVSPPKMLTSAELEPFRKMTKTPELRDFLVAIDKGDKSKATALRDSLDSMIANQTKQVCDLEVANEQFKTTIELLNNQITTLKDENERLQVELVQLQTELERASQPAGGKPATRKRGK